MSRVYSLIKKTIFIFCLTLLLPCIRTEASGIIDPSQNAGLILYFTPDSVPAEGTEFRIYKIAEVSGQGTFSLMEAFRGHAISFENMEQEDWKEMAATLQGIVNADKITADYTVKIDQEGKGVVQQMQTGLYLVCGEVFKSGGKCYTPQTYLICIPGRKSDGTWKYQVESVVKFDAEPDKTLTLDFLKVWKNDDAKDRPEKIVVEVYRDRTLYQTIELGRNNNWRYTLRELDSSAVWSVKEKEIPDGYRVLVEKQGKRFVINNIKTTEPETEPETVPETEPESQPEPESETEPETVTEPGNVPKKEKEPEILPQTGVLWWPVPVLAAAGILLILIGMLLRRGSADD